MAIEVKIDWSHLPQRVWDKVCTCYGANGFGLDQETGFWVHGCGKPRLPTCVLMCDECDVPFVPDHKKEVDASFFGAMCNDCKP